MGHKYQLNLLDVTTQINRAAAECSNPYTDGWVGFGYKQDLYRIKWVLEDALRRCPSFSGEEEWVKEQEQKQLIEILKK